MIDATEPRTEAARALDTLLSVRGLRKDFALPPRGFLQGSDVVHALDGVSFDLWRGETLGIVGESGSGKSTIARVLMGIEPPTAGEAWLDGAPLFQSDPVARRKSRRAMQMVFQDPYGSLDPRMTVFQIVAEPWQIHADVVPSRERRERVATLMLRVGLDPEDMDKPATMFSGGQRQRIGIARALALSPSVLILDEPVSALDVSIQAQIVELLRELQESAGLAMIFIAHDLAVVRSLAHRVAVMYLGRIVEMGDADSVYGDPHHPYTRALLSAAPAFHASAPSQRIRLKGEVPSPIDRPQGCHFHTRCWLRDQLGAPDLCVDRVPDLATSTSGQLVACHFSGSDEVVLDGPSSPDVR